MAKRKNQDVAPNEDPKRAERKARAKAKRAKKKEALKAVAQFVKDNSQDESLLEAAALITPGVRVGGIRASRKDVIEEAFQNQDAIHEDEIWAEYKMGRTDMRKACIGLIKKKAPEDRMWIGFDPDSGMYTLEGTGPNPPAGWTGYRPVDMEDMEI